MQATITPTKHDFSRYPPPQHVRRRKDGAAWGLMPLAVVEVNDGWRLSLGWDLEALGILPHFWREGKPKPYLQSLCKDAVLDSEARSVEALRHTSHFATWLSRVWAWWPSKPALRLVVGAPEAPPAVALVESIHGPEHITTPKGWLAEGAYVHMAAVLRNGDFPSDKAMFDLRRYYKFEVVEYEASDENADDPFENYIGLES